MTSICQVPASEIVQISPITLKLLPAPNDACNTVAASVSIDCFLYTCYFACLCSRLLRQDKN